MKWICWFNSILLANSNLLFLSYCYRIDYQNACRTRSIQLPADDLEDVALTPITVPDGPFIEYGASPVGVRILAQKPRLPFRKYYYLIALLTWITTNLVLSIWGIPFLRENLRTPELYGIFISPVSSLPMVLLVFLTALIRREAKALWNHTEDWQLKIDGTTVERCDNQFTPTSNVSNRVTITKRLYRSITQAIDRILLWVQDTQIISCFIDIFYCLD